MTVRTASGEWQMQYIGEQVQIRSVNRSVISEQIHLGQVDLEHSDV